MAEEKKSLLIIEDEEELSNLFKDFFEVNGFEVEVALNGEQALEKLGTKNFSLFITDICMPEIGGHIVIHKIRNKHPDTPIIAMSGYSQFQVEDIIEWGASHFFAKPVMLDQLKDKVDELLAAS